MANQNLMYRTLTANSDSL